MALRPPSLNARCISKMVSLFSALRAASGDPPGFPRQHHRFHLYRTGDARQMVGASQRDRAQDDASGVADATAIGQFGAVKGAAPSFGVEISAIGVRNAAEIERGITAFAHEPNGGLIVLPVPMTVIHRNLIIKLAAQHRLPAVY